MEKSQPTATRNLKILQKLLSISKVDNKDWNHNALNQIISKNNSISICIVLSKAETNSRSNRQKQRKTTFDKNMSLG